MNSNLKGTQHYKVTPMKPTNISSAPPQIGAGRPTEPILSQKPTSAIWQTLRNPKKAFTTRINKSKYTILYYTILYYTILHYTILLYCTVLYCTVLYCTILYYTILYYTILYYTILYYTILYYTILYYTISCPYFRCLPRNPKSV